MALSAVVFEFPFAGDFGRDIRQQVGCLDALAVGHLPDAFGGGEQVFVVLQGFADEFLQRRIGIDFPPLHIGQSQGVRPVGCKTLG